MNREQEGLENSDQVTPEAKRKYFEKLAFEHLPEMRLLFRSGKLLKNEGWRNVIEHSIVQAAVVEAMSELLELSNTEKEELVKSALCHDWAKRIETQPDSFPDDSLKQASQSLKSINPDPNLMNSTGPDFVKKATKGETSFLQRVQFYADDICEGSEIVSLDERIDEVSSRRTDLNGDEELTEQLGMPYWDAERKIGHDIEEEFARILKQKGIMIDSPSQIPSIIMEKINNDILSSVDPSPETSGTA